MALAEQLGGSRGAALAAQAQSAFVDGLGLAMLIAAGVVAAAAVFVFVRAPRLAAPPRGEEPPVKPRLAESFDRG
jgi:hypothetical protein